MSKGNRFTEEFKLEAVKQVVERGLGVADVSKRLPIAFSERPHSSLDKMKPN